VLRVLRAYPRCDQKTAIAFIDDVMAKLPFKVERVQTDNGSEFGASFHWHLLDKGIDHVKIRPRTPRLNGKVERSHRIDSKEFYRLLQGQVIDDTNPFTEKLQELGGLLQLPPSSRRPWRPNTLRTPPTENPRPTVIGLRQVAHRILRWTPKKCSCQLQA
jgi:transposase InsO family protein